MSTIDRILELSKQKGIKQTFMCDRLNVDNSYFRTVKKQNSTIPPERLAQIADILGTTVEYLNGETDNPEKEKSPSPKDGLTVFESTILQLLAHVPEDRQDELASLIESALKMSGLLK